MFYRRVLLNYLSGPRSQGKVRLLFGARQVGKTALLRQLLPSGSSILYNLQDSSVRRRFEVDPASFSREVRALPASVTHVAIDEIQKVPSLLEEVQDLYDRQPNRFQFFLTGSSARRLRQGSANLLPGRCHVYTLFPTVRTEEEGANAAGLEVDGNLIAGGDEAGVPGFPARAMESRLLLGNLPGVSLEHPESAAATLDGYVTNYVEEEIRREALVRDVGAFLNFVRLSAAESGGSVNLAALSRESGIASATLASFYGVLQDTFIGYQMNAYRGSARKRLLTTPRFYYFDLGVRAAAAGVPVNQGLAPTRAGQQFEHWVALELLHRARYLGRGFDVQFWRTATGAEVDFVWVSPTRDIPIEVKWTEHPQPRDARHLETFLDLHPDRCSQGLVVCRVPRRQQLTDRVTALPWQEL